VNPMHIFMFLWYALDMHRRVVRGSGLRS